MPKKKKKKDKEKKTGKKYREKEDWEKEDQWKEDTWKDTSKQIGLVCGIGFIVMKRSSLSGVIVATVMTRSKSVNVEYRILNYNYYYIYNISDCYMIAKMHDVQKKRWKNVLTTPLPVLAEVFIIHTHTTPISWLEHFKIAGYTPDTVVAKINLSVVS